MRYAVAAKLAGLSVSEPFDAGLLAFAGLTPEHATACFESWTTATETNRAEFHRLLARALRGHRLLSESLTVAVVPHASGWLQVAGDPEANVWPFAIARDVPDVCTHSATQWREAWANILDEETQLQHTEAPEMLTAMLEAFAVPAIREPQAEATVTITAQAIMRMWARWLGRLSSSSTPYLLSQLVRRGGWLTRDRDELLIELEPRALDVALQLAGYLEPLELPPGWGVRIVRFQIGGTR
jgi:hypothetical protein